jgi:4'-phosphopantetheinyl transferase
VQLGVLTVLCAAWPALHRLPPLEPGAVHLWSVDLDRCPLDDCRRLLAVDECARADRFRFERDRRRFIVARALLRSLLARYLTQDPAELRFAYNAFGKPLLSTRSGVSFNVSHSGRLALLAVAGGDTVGVDVERLRRDFDFRPIARRFFAPREVATLEALPPWERRRAFFACWTRKEAVVKAHGSGLSLPLDTFEVSLAPDAPPAVLWTGWNPAEAPRWSLRELEPAAGYLAALAVRADGLWRRPSVEGH